MIVSWDDCHAVGFHVIDRVGFSVSLIASISWEMKEGCELTVRGRRLIFWARVAGILCVWPQMILSWNLVLWHVVMTSGLQCFAIWNEIVRWAGDTTGSDSPNWADCRWGPCWIIFLLLQGRRHGARSHLLDTLHSSAFTVDQWVTSRYSWTNWFGLGGKGRGDWVVWGMTVLMCSLAFFVGTRGLPPEKKHRDSRACGAWVLMRKSTCTRPNTNKVLLWNSHLKVTFGDDVLEWAV